MGDAIRLYYNDLRHYFNPSTGDEMEIADEVKAPYSYRYWAFMKWASDLRKRLLGQPVFHIHEVYDHDGTVLTEKLFTDIFHQVHHVWHPNLVGTGWTTPTPFLKTSVGQHRRKKEISRTQIGAEFFFFHREHLEVFRRWLTRTGQDKVQPINTCAHDTTVVSPNPNDATWPAALDDLDVIPSPDPTSPYYWENYLGNTAWDFPPGLGYPLTSYGITPTPTTQFAHSHSSYWEEDLSEFSNLGEMGQIFARDGNPFMTNTINRQPPVIGNPNPNGSPIIVTGTSDSGYHGIGHVINGDLIQAVANNHSVRFYAWHGFIDEVWKKREPRFLSFAPIQDNGTDYPAPGILTILREFSPNADLIDPPFAVAAGYDLATGNGKISVKINVKPDNFDAPLNLVHRPFDLVLRCEVLREAGATPATPVIALTRTLEIVYSGATPSQRNQNIDFIEEFDFDGSTSLEGNTLDSDGEGPFKADNPLFSPTPVGFKNSRIKIKGYLVCRFRPDGNIAPASGTISSVGTTVTGVGTNFLDETPALPVTGELRQGDLIRVGGIGGEVRMVVHIANDTSLTLLEPFSSNLSGVAYERLDGFDHESVIEIPLIQEKQAPEVTTYLDRSTFSLDQVVAVASGGTTSVFTNAFYVVLQDRTSRPLNIVWPPEVEPALRNLIAPPVYAAGLYYDSANPLAHTPLVELRDAGTNALIPGVAVTVTDAQPESPSQHPGIPQRITYPCEVTFTDTGTGWDPFTGLVAGFPKDVKLVITARDRSGNQVVDDSKRVRLQINANPYMLDGPTSWLSIDARVFQIWQGQARFGVPAGWTDPNIFIQDVITNFRNGTASVADFDNVPTDQGAAVLEYSPATFNPTAAAVQNVYNFALSKVRLQSQNAPPNVRATFRLFRWGTANVEFNHLLAYRSAPSGVGLLGLTTTTFPGPLASIPFFAEPRFATNVDMNAQTDGPNLDSTFGTTVLGEAFNFYGAYLDINQTALRFPTTIVSDKPSDGSPLLSIRDLLVDHHQCMVVELVEAGDPTVPGATPGNSDNLAQRNLLIVQTANPGNEITRTVQHAFNIDLTRNRRYWKNHDPNDGHHDDDGDDDHHGDQPTHRHTDHPHQTDGSLAAFLEGNCCEEIKVRPARPALVSGVHGTDGHPNDHLGSGWIAQSPEHLKKIRERNHLEAEKQRRWTFDAVDWKPGTGLDELAIFWNNLPKESEVTLFLPGANVEEIFNYRNLRHAPRTVQIVDSHTLRLFPEGTTYLPIPAFWGNNLAGMFNVKLPPGIKKGQRFKVDVLQMRAHEARTLGGFQLNIQVEKAHDLWQADLRWLELFHKRLSITPKSDRWEPIVAKQVEFARSRAKAMVELNNEENPTEPPVQWTDPTVNQRGQKIRVVLEKIQILDDREPWFKGKGEFRFYAKVFSPDNGGILREAVFPSSGYFKLSDRPGSNEVQLDATLFEDWADTALGIEIGGVELDTFDPDDTLASYKRVFQGKPADWLANYAPTGDPIDPQNMGGWKLWYRIEYAG
ncbi:MAG: hypothetical protein H7Y12_13840 [Sphingobacteriaceae bacterium]|nr:hypothetical protein [Cytophagaceae bacterium]